MCGSTLMSPSQPLIKSTDLVLVVLHPGPVERLMLLVLSDQRAVPLNLVDKPYPVELVFLSRGSHKRLRAVRCQRLSLRLLTSRCPERSRTPFTPKVHGSSCRTRAA